MAMWASIESEMQVLARLLLFNGIVLISVRETLAFVKKIDERTRYTTVVFGVELGGYLLLLYAILKEDVYNHGLGYMLGSFLISISKELVIVGLLVP